MLLLESFGKILVKTLTRIPTLYRVHLIDTGYEGRARDSRPPQPHPPGDLFLTGGPDESLSCLGHVLRGGTGRAGRGVGGRSWGGGGGVRGVSAPHNR
jgi:hypothetical protein